MPVNYKTIRRKVEHDKNPQSNNKNTPKLYGSPIFPRCNYSLEFQETLSQSFICECVCDLYNYAL